LGADPFLLNFEIDKFHGVNLVGLR
jgi:hypothetical protein